MLMYHCRVNSIEKMEYVYIFFFLCEEMCVEDNA